MRHSENLREEKTLLLNVNRLLPSDSQLSKKNGPMISFLNLERILMSIERGSEIGQDLKVDDRQV